MISFVIISLFRNTFDRTYCWVRKEILKISFLLKDQRDFKHVMQIDKRYSSKFVNNKKHLKIILQHVFTLVHHTRIKRTRSFYNVKLALFYLTSEIKIICNADYQSEKTISIYETKRNNFKYSQRCVQWPPSGPKICGGCWQVVAVQRYIHVIKT